MTEIITFLLVDDDKDDTSLFEEMLQQINSAVRFRWAKDGQEALDQLRTGDSFPDLIFLDLNMPRMDGKEFLARVKADEKIRDIPVVIYTTSSQSRDVEETMQSGAACYIAKPSNIKELKAILSSIVESIPHNLGKVLRKLSINTKTFMA